MAGTGFKRLYRRCITKPTFRSLHRVYAYIPTDIDINAYNCTTFNNMKLFKALNTIQFSYSNFIKDLILTNKHTAQCFTRQIKYFLDIFNLKVKNIILIGT